MNLMGEFLVREGGVILSWWLLVTLAGLVVTPLAMRLLGGLPDRGITLARPLGLLLVGFVFWLTAILGFVRNDTGGMALAYVIVLALGLGALLTSRGPIDLRAWWKANRTGILVGEILFAVALIVWAIYKAHQNDAFTTEKPMELAFLSGVMRSETFPPNDPWFAGYAISYYYFGYVIAAMLSTLSGVSSGVGFSMIHALLFALVASSVYGVVYNLVRSRGASPDEPELDDDPGFNHRRGPGSAILTGLLGVTFVLIMGNFVLPLVEYPYQTGTASTDYLSFWNMNERVQPKTVSSSGALETWDYWWWFRAARAISDRGLDGNHSEVIDEFPAFSFVLSDNHPHVLALPFAALAVGLMLNVALTRRRPDTPETLLYGVVIGGLIFLNTWDGAIYLLGLAAAEGLRRLMASRTGRLSGSDWAGIVFFGLGILVIGVISVFPFLFSFRSQLAGILPNLIDPTSFNQFFLMFGPLLLVLVPYLLVEVWRGRARADMRFGLTLGLGILTLLALVMILLAVVGALLPGASGILSRVINENGGASSALMEVLTKRITHLPTALLLTVMLVLAAARLFGRIGDSAEPDGSSRYPVATGMVLLLIALGAALILAPEFVYLRDNFGTRMNTVFKFYYQTWLVWGMAGAYAVYSVLGDARLRLPSPAARAAFGATVAVVLLIATPYLFMASYFRATVEAGRGPNTISRVPTLDGAESYMVMGGISADDMAALACLDQQVTSDDVVVVQAAGNSYNGAYGIAGTLEGLPVLFNWYGHQGQWRGDALGALVGSRLSDIDVIYTEPTWNATRSVLAMYGVDYVFVGATERRAYGDRLATVEYKLRDNLKLVCDFGETQVYSVPEQVLEIASGS